MLLGTMALLPFGGLFLVAPDTRAEAAAPTYDQAVGVLRLYCKYLNQRNYKATYNLRRAALQRKQSYSSFAAGFSRTAQNSLKLSGTAASGARTVVRCELDATLTSGGSQVFRGAYTIGRENGHVRILSANLAIVG